MLKKTKHFLDLKLIVLLSALYAFYLIIYTFKNVYLILKNPNVVKTDWNIFFFNSFLDWIIVSCFLALIVYMTKMMMQKKVRLFYIIVIHLFFSFFLGIFILGATWLTENFIENQSIKGFIFDDYFIWFIRLIDIHFLIYVSSATIIYMYYYYNKIQETQILTAKLEGQLSHSTLKMLQSQMLPHFLFNTLNSIYSLMDIDVNKSKSMVIDLSDLLRSILEKKDQNLIELQDELFILKKYINIKKTRFPDQLTFNINIESELENVLVPNMLLQPIVENSIKHGYSKKHLTLEIFINIYKKNGYLVVKIENTGKKLDEEVSVLLKKGTGLSNIKERLTSLYGKNCNLNIYNKPSTVITLVSFPIQLSLSEIAQNY
jgi:two-component system LytT family sensor kinase